MGVTAVWIPPAYKGKEQNDVGYGTYDLFDLGEFDQKNTVRTKYGTRQELQEAIKALHEHHVGVYLDAVMNHKAGADYTEKFMAKEVDQQNRDKEITDAYEIEGWTGFNFPGRGNKYSDFKWHWYHFTGTDYDARTEKTSIFKIMGDGKSWSEGVDEENGNYDYLMFANLDFNHPEVVKEMERWGIWVSRELDLDGMRLDAIKHINDEFIRKFLAAVRKERGADFYAVGEYWKQDLESLDDYLKEERYKVDLFDVPCTTTCTRPPSRAAITTFPKFWTEPWFRTTLRWPLPLWTTMIPSGAVPWNQLWKTGSSPPPMRSSCS